MTYTTIQAPTYADLNILPAPVTTGTTTQVFTDIWSEVWVAKNGVNGGNWNKARDVLHASVTRTAAFTTPTGSSLFGFDTVTRDTYGMWVPNPTYGWVVPVTAIYRVHWHYGISGAAVGEYCNASILTNGGNISLHNNFAAVAGGLYGRAEALARLTALTDTTTASYFTSVAEAGVTGAANVSFSIDYLGTL
jgi:hypothetical protein